MYSDNVMRGARFLAKFIRAMLSPAAMSVVELADYTGLGLNTIRRYIAALREHEPKLAYIRRWDKDPQGRYSIPCYGLGTEADAIKPRRTEAEKRAADRKRIRKPNVRKDRTQYMRDWREKKRKEAANAKPPA